jgi:hypothetical protein
LPPLPQKHLRACGLCSHYLLPTYYHALLRDWELLEHSCPTSWSSMRMRCGNDCLLHASEDSERHRSHSPIRLWTGRDMDPKWCLPLVSHNPLIDMCMGYGDLKSQDMLESHEDDPMVHECPALTRLLPSPCCVSHCTTTKTWFAHRYTGLSLRSGPVRAQRLGLVGPMMISCLAWVFSSLGPTSRQ